MKFTSKQSKLTTGAVIITVLLVLLIKWTAPETSPEMQALPKARIELYQVQTKDIAVTETVNGRLAPLRRTQLKFEVSGRLASRSVEAGQRFERGEVLLAIEDDDYRDIMLDAQARLEEEQAAIRRDKTLLKLVRENTSLQQKEVKRLERLRKKSLTSQSSLDAARQQLSALQREVSRLQYSVDSSAARMQKQRSSLQRAQRNLDRCRLTSPWKGVVNKVYVEQGDSVSPSQVALELIDDSRLEFVLSLRGAIARHLRRDGPVAVRLGDKTIEAKITALQLDPDPTTFTHEVRVTLPAGIGHAGQMVEATLTLPPMQQAMVVPVTALQYEDGSKYVMRYTQGLIKRQKIELGPRVGNQQIVLGGLEAGHAIVSRDVASLSDGQQVEVIKTLAEH